MKITKRKPLIYWVNKFYEQASRDGYLNGDGTYAQIKNERYFEYVSNCEKVIDDIRMVLRKMASNEECVNERWFKQYHMYNWIASEVSICFIRRNYEKRCKAGE